MTPARARPMISSSVTADAADGTSAPIRIMPARTSFLRIARMLHTVATRSPPGHAQIMRVFYILQCSPPRTTFIRKGQSPDPAILLSFRLLHGLTKVAPAGAPVHRLPLTGEVQGVPTMLSNRLAFAALAIACLGAAAGGGYLATRQNVVPSPASAQVQPLPPATTAAAPASPLTAEQPLSTAPLAPASRAVQETEAVVGDRTPSTPASPVPAPRTSNPRRSEAAARTGAVRDSAAARSVGAVGRNRRAPGTAAAVDEHLAERRRNAAAGAACPARAGREPGADVQSGRSRGAGTAASQSRRRGHSKSWSSPRTR